MDFYTAWMMHLVLLTWSILSAIVATDRLMLPTHTAFQRCLNVLLMCGCLFAWAVGVGCAMQFAGRMGH